MKKLLTFALAFSILASPVLFAGKITEKVEKLMETNQTRYERTYYPRDMKPNYLALSVGYPYMSGINYSYNINEIFSIGLGAGSYFPGLALGLHATVYPLATIISPYVGGGITYIGLLPTTGTVAAHGEAGIDIALENGLNFNLGAVYLISFSEATSTFGTLWEEQKNKFNNISMQAGLGFRF
jgi:opacity protein-like surface antigen